MFKKKEIYNLDIVLKYHENDWIVNNYIVQRKWKYEKRFKLPSFASVQYSNNWITVERVSKYFVDPSKLKKGKKYHIQVLINEL